MGLGNVALPISSNLLQEKNGDDKGREVFLNHLSVNKVLSQMRNAIVKAESMQFFHSK